MLIRGDSLAMVSDLSTSAPSSIAATGSAGAIDVDIRDHVGIGVDADPGDYSSLYSRGDLRIHARTVALAGRASIGSYTDPTGAVKVDASESVSISGRSTVATNGGPLEIWTSSLAIDNGGSIRSSAADGILAHVDRLSMTNGAMIETLNFGAAASGGVVVKARDSTTISGDDATGIFSSVVCSNCAMRSGDIRVETGTFSLTGGALMESGSPGVGQGGSLSITGDDSITIADGSGIRSRGSFGIGQIQLKTPLLSMDNGFISADTNVSAIQSFSAGDIRADVGTLIMSHGAQISSSSEVLSSGTGGNITIGPSVALILEGGSAIETRAKGEGSGGRIAITSQSVFPPLMQQGATFVSFEPYKQGVSGARISAAAGNPELSGTVEINTPETDIESQVSALAVPYLGAQSIASACAARASGQTGSFEVARSRGLPASPEELLLASDEPEGAEVDVASGAPSDADAASAPANNELAAGLLAMRGGKAEVAEDRFAKALEVLGPTGDAGLRSDAKRGLGQAQQARGDFGASRDSLQAAVALAQQADDARREAMALSLLGATQIAMREPAEAERVLVRGLEVAKRGGPGGLASQLENDLGNEAAAQQHWQEALPRYEAAAAHAHAAGRTEQEATALASAARVAVEAGDLERAPSLLGSAEEPLARMSGLAAVRVAIHLGKSYELLASLVPGADERAVNLRRSYVQRSFARLQAAAAGAQALGDARLDSFALGNLGGLYESEHRNAEALYLTRLALARAEAAEASDAQYQWLWQEGRILWAQGKAEPALASYRRAVEIVEATRQVSLVHYGSGALRFQRAVAPVYRDYVDALLTSSDLVGANTNASRRLLDEARGAMEQYQAAELRDYFVDECVADIEAHTLDLDRVLREQSPKTAVVYPIALEKRLELLVSLPGGAERFTVPVSAAELEATATRFREVLTDRTSRRYEPVGEQLYRWLVAPYEARLQQAGIETLVFVPGGALRTIPLSALYDGEHFLVEKYAVAVTPGLSLVDPRHLDARGGRFLLAGLSTGGEFANHEFDPLPNVTTELGAIRKLYGGDVLLDAGFEAPRFQRAVVEREPTVVHVASHAYFGGGPDESFLLTHDGAMSFDQLGQVIGPRRYTKAPLELLVLSACQTAAGDDRAALGLAGVAIRSGARSALGSLWAISDEATYAVMTAFYEALAEPEISKAKALQQAQLALLRPDSAFRHPFFWSPYLLISNWL
ncbi:MAG: CHAT domain-containing protein [Deltaproteobacteria bacterium]|nr:MAG: CHAT domain-containing protein [Deltaproteobacteria bacterium]